MKIKDVNLIDSITGTEKVPVSAGTDAPATVSLDQIKVFIKEIPDWRSSEGESGYINGRTHYNYIGASETPIVDVNVPRRSNDEPVVELIKTNYSWDPISFNIAIGGDSLSFVDDKEYDNNYYNPEIKLTWDFFEQSSYTHRLYYENMGVLVVDLTAYYEYISEEECYKYYIRLERVSNSGYEGSRATVRLHNIVTKYKTLDDKFIPNTVLKTTPQTLTDAEKTQIKENLGIDNNNDNDDANNITIDPVVWKYMLNPFVIIFEDYGTPELDTTTLPDDLLSILNNNVYLGRFLLVARNIDDFEYIIVECVHSEYPYYKFSYGSNKTLKIGFSESGTLNIY